EPGFAGTDVAKGLAWARDRLVQSRRKLKTVYLFTDLLRNGLDRSPAPDLPPNAAIEVVDVGHPLTGNLAVDDVRAAKTDLRPGQPVIITARVYNAGPLPAKEVPVRLNLDGEGGPIRDEQVVTIDGESRQLVRFQVALKQPGIYKGSVEVV